MRARSKAAENGRLIDVLLEALKEVERHHVALNKAVKRSEERSYTLTVVREAIAKAERNNDHEI